MPGRRVFDLIEIPDSLWQRADVLEALRRVTLGACSSCYIQYTGPARPAWLSPVKPPSPRSAGTCAGPRRSKNWSVFERIADGLNMPDPARIALGLAPMTLTTARPCTGPAGYPATGYPPGLAWSRCIRSAQRRRRRQRGG